MRKIKIPRKLLPVVTTPRRFTVLIGGRGSRKSTTIADVMLMCMETEGADCLCLREFQDSIDDSVHKLFKKRIQHFGLTPNITDKKISFEQGNGTRYKGAHRNPDSIQSAEGFKYSWFEEAHRASQDSITKLLPTIRAPGSRLFFSANPQNSEDPFSKRFIVPYQDALERDGYYIDDLHLIIKVNWRDNPDFPAELEAQRQWDYENLTREEYDHIWEGAFNDSIENNIIKPEWFDACIDAHIKLGFAGKGAKFAAHDPSDTGPDSKGYAERIGSIVTLVEERTTGDTNEGCDWATGLANANKIDRYTWDCDGLGVSLNRQTVDAFKDKSVAVSQFKGSEGPDHPDATYQPAVAFGDTPQKKNKDVFRNKRAQYYTVLRDKIYKTYRAVTNESEKYKDPDEMISFCSNIPALKKLRSELCRMPIKPRTDGLVELYTKAEMKVRFKLPSPNLADSVMMLMRNQARIENTPKIPRPIKTMGNRRRSYVA